MLGIGIVGAGFMSRTHAFGIGELVHGAACVAVTGGSRAPSLAADFGLALEPSLESLLARSDVDIVFLGTPTQVHRDQAIAAAKAGRHVFTEKPIAASLPEIDAMIAACRIRRSINRIRTSSSPIPTPSGCRTSWTRSTRAASPK